MPAHVQQVIARELAQEKVRRKAAPAGAAAPHAATGDEAVHQQAAEPTGYSLQNKTAQEKAQFIKARMGLSAEDMRAGSKLSLQAPLVARDFFGRVIEPASLALDANATASQTAAAVAAVAAAAAAAVPTRRVHFRFQEGFSNAVRRPVKLRDLL